MTIRVTPFLRRALALDAAMSGLAAAAFVAGAGLIASLTMLPQALLFWAGVVLVPWTALLGWAATRGELASLLVKDVIGVNVLWAAASFGLLVSGMVQPNALGVALVVVQAIAVAVFAWLQSVGLRDRSPAAGAA
jgi:hypothetical protein